MNIQSNPSEYMNKTFVFVSAAEMEIKTNFEKMAFKDMYYNSNLQMQKKKKLNVY